jgi:hypothetical protein
MNNRRPRYEYMQQSWKENALGMPWFTSQIPWRIVGLIQDSMNPLIVRCIRSEERASRKQRLLLPGAQSSIAVKDL